MKLFGKGRIFPLRFKALPASTSSEYFHLLAMIHNEIFGKGRIFPLRLKALPASTSSEYVHLLVMIHNEILDVSSLKMSIQTERH